MSGSTRFIALIGHPVVQVKSPEPLNRWFDEHAAGAVILPMDVQSDRVGAFLEAMRATENCIGVSVTMPHKQAAFALADEVSDRARQVRAANILRRTTDGRLVGDMVDGIGMMTALEANGVSVVSRHVLVVGAGGAGTAIIHAAAEKGAAVITVIEADVARAREVVSGVSTRHPDIRVRTDLPASDTVDIAINASPAGMKPGDPHPFPLERLAGSTIIADVVTRPALTPWLVAAREQGLKIQAGAEMTLAQLSIQLNFWGFPAEAVQFSKRDRA
ncbi:shikimate dehydrogenase [Rhizobium herbae]|uniref:Shikimate dehydrogenase n=1 Tax=Rhizobium herbae TaxID=508661 RepID=A0ABS7HCE1_9HYPH|nr:shikimate dehydrogenase [Rhizobium herbae]